MTLTRNSKRMMAGIAALAMAVAAAEPAAGMIDIGTPAGVVHRPDVWRASPSWVPDDVEVEFVGLIPGPGVELLNPLHAGVPIGNGTATGQ